jgi:hypothetical protein
MPTRKKATRRSSKTTTRRAKAPAKRTARRRTARAARPAARSTGPRVGWWEITLSDKASSDKVKRFFTSVFGWKIDSDPQYDYGQVTAAQAGIGGGIGPGAPGAPNKVTFYIEVPDITAYLKKIEAAGGKTVMPETNMGTVSFGQFNDPAGNLVGLFKGSGAAD